MKKTTFFKRFLRETRLGLVTSCLLIAGALTQTLSAQTTNTAVKGGDINTLATWGIAAPSSGDANIWSTGAYALSSTLPATFNGGTLDIATSGSLTLNTAGPVTLTLNNLTLDGGSIIAGAAMNAVTLDLQNKTFTLNSGIFTTNANQGGRSILVQNAKLAGSGNITIAQYKTGTGLNLVELTNTGVTTSGFTGTFTVVPGESGTTAHGGELKISAPTSGTFGVSVPKPTGTGSYTGSVAGKLFFNPGAGNTCTLASLNLGGHNIAPGTYAYTDFAVTDTVYLDKNSTGTIIIPAVLPAAPTSVVATEANGVASVAFTGGSATSFTVTPYDVSTSTAGTPVSGTSSPISVTGLTTGDFYTFTVTATNSTGTSPVSAPSNQITINPAPGTVNAVANGEINTLTTWSADNSIPIPLAGDANIWSVGEGGTTYFTISETTSPVTFFGGTFILGNHGTLSMNGLSGEILNLNNLTLDGGWIIAGANPGPVILNLITNTSKNTFTLNSGTFKVNPNQATRNIQIQNANLAGSGNISIVPNNAGTNEGYVELTSTVTTSGFTGTFTVQPGVSGIGMGGELKISAPTSGTFGVSVPAPTGIGSYAGDNAGKLFFNPGAGNTCTLASLSLGGTTITPGTYTYADFANYGGTTNLQAYLNSNSTGSVTVTGLGTGLNQLVQNNLVIVKDRGFQLNNGTASLQVYNTVGTCLINKQNVSAGATITLPNAGVYLVKAKTENGTSVQKIMIK